MIRKLFWHVPLISEEMLWEKFIRNVLRAPEYFKTSNKLPNISHKFSNYFFSHLREFANGRKFTQAKKTFNLIKQLTTHCAHCPRCALL